MTTPPKQYFSKVREAREALKARSLEVFDLYMDLARKALDLGEMEQARKALEYLMEHMPDDEGVTMLGTSIDAKKEVSKESGTKIQIGIALGGMNQQKELPPTQIVDISVPPDVTED